MSLPSEQFIAAPVVEWFEALGNTVGQEVALENGCVADIVAQRGPRITVCEVKTAMSKLLLSQCMRHQGTAHVLYAAVPGPVTATLCRHAARFDAEGIGVLIVNAGGCVDVLVEPVARAPSHSRTPTLQAGHSSGAYAQAGSANGGHYTAHSERARAVVEYVTDHPDCSILDICSAVSPNQDPERLGKVLDQQIRKSHIKGITRKGSGRMRRYRIEGASL